jgi:hypothetical protein
MEQKIKMDAVLKLLDNEVFSEETKKAISDAFVASLEEAKAAQAKQLREEFATRYDTDKEKIAEAIQQYVDQKNEAEMVEFHADMKALNEQRMKYVNAQATLKEHAKKAIAQRLQVFEKAIQRALVKETKELHEDLKVNRSAAVRAINESKQLAEADRNAFRTKGAKVLEHILKVQFDSKLRSMQEDIEKAKQNDFGSRIFEAFMGEARRLFFNSHKEIRGLLKTIQEQQSNFESEKQELLQQLSESHQIARKAVGEVRQIKESALRAQKMNRLLAPIPTGNARDAMRRLLEASSVKDMERTFEKFRGQVLTEAPLVRKPQAELTEFAGAGARFGHGHQTVAEDVDDDEIQKLRDLAGIGKVSVRR